MNVNEIKIFFRTLFDRSGSEQAKKALKETTSEIRTAGTSAGTASTALDGMFDTQKAGRGNKTAQVIGDVRQAVGGLQGGIEGASGSLQGLIKLFPSLAAMAGPIGILSVALAGVVKLLTYLNEKALAAFSALQKSQIDNITSSAERLTAAYTRQRDELQRIYDIRNRLNAAGDENRSAARRLEDAQAETVYQSAMAAAGTDETLKNELTAEYNLMKANLAVAREIEDSKTKTARIEEETNLALEKRKSLQAEYADKEQLLNRLLEMQKYNVSKMITTAQGRNDLFGDSKTKAYSEATANTSTEVQNVLNSMQDLRKQLNDIPIVQGVNQLRTRTENLNRAVSGEAGVQAGITYAGAQAGIAAARDKEALAALERLNEAATGMSPEFVRALQRVVDNLNAQKRFTTAEIDRLTRDTQIQRQRSIGF